MGGAPSLSQQGFTTRPATKDDLDDLTRIHIEGFTEEPQIHYRYPFRHQYPEDHWKWTRKEYENYLEQPQKYVVYVAEALRYVHGSIAVNPIGHAVWNVAVLTEAAKGDPAQLERRDADQKRCDAFFSRAGQRFKTHFAKWGAEQINLSPPVVHPDFRLRGAGTKLVRWGIEVAEGKGWPVTLCASPMSLLLYEHLGFEKIASEVVQVEGEEETLTSAVMIYGGKQG